MKNNKRIWLVGGSSGIGLELAKLLLKNDYKLIVSSRSATKSDSLKQLKEEYTDNLNLLDLDVTLKENIKEKVQKAWSFYGGLDIWFYNVGTYEVMDINNWDYEKYSSMNSSIYLGAVNLMTTLSPFFIKQKQGRWLWNLSLSSYFGLPKGGGYSAPKAALLNLAQAIEPELKTKNIKLQIINHGFVKTRLTKKNSFEMPQLMEATYAAKKIFKGIEKDSSFEIKFPFKLRLALQFLSLVPYKLSLFLTKKTL